MKSTFTVNSLLAFSELENKYFHCEFGRDLNLIYGRNTAGKSTLLQLLLYTFGINDNNIKLAGVLSERIFVRVDFTLRKGEAAENYTIIREDGTQWVKEPTGRVVRFNGVDANHSYEHVKLKDYLRQLFDFELFLETKDGVVEAPLETIFLPYYVSQDVGWVYLRKSFSNLNFYKNFKDDLLDYYLGIENAVEREERREAEEEVNKALKQRAFLASVENDSTELKVSEVLAKTLQGKANEFVESLSEKKGSMLKYERDYVRYSNSLSFYQQRLAVVSKVARNHKSQVPGANNCPTCAQLLPRDLEKMYGYFQESNDTVREKDEIKKNIKNLQSKLNGLSRKIDDLRSEVEKDNLTFSKYAQGEVTLTEYLDNQANARLKSNIDQQMGRLTATIEKYRSIIEEFKTDDEIMVDRKRRDSRFRNFFLEYNSMLELPQLEDRRFTDVYNISSFPFQGVNLHMTVMSYHFAFNRLISETPNIHRFPFLLDSIFEGDVEGVNRDLILQFIKKNKPLDTQCIFTIADAKEKDSHIDYYSRILGEGVRLICIGGGTRQRALLQKNDGRQESLINDTIEIMEG